MSNDASSSDDGDGGSGSGSGSGSAPPTSSAAANSSSTSSTNPSITSSNDINTSSGRPGRPGQLMVRPPLDVYKKIVILRTHTDEVVYQDEAGRLQKLSGREVSAGAKQKEGGEKDAKDKTTDATDSTNQKPKQPPPASAASTASAPQKKKDIPTPNITLVPDYTRNVPPTYHVPTAFVRHVPKTVAQVESSVEYNLDKEDEDWWTHHDGFGPQAGWIVPPSGSNEEGDGEGVEEEGGDITMEDVDGGSTPPPAALTTKQLRKGIYQLPTSPAKKVRKIPPPPGTVLPPTLPLEHLENILDLLEKSTGFDVPVSQGEAERIIFARIPDLVRRFAPTKKKRGNGRSSSSRSNTPRSSPRASPLLSTLGDTPTHASTANTTTTTTVYTPRTVLDDVYKYWLNKRGRLRKPLLRKYWPVTSANDTNPHLVFRPRDKEKMRTRRKRTDDMEAYRKMKRLRDDFVRLRSLIDLVVRRERLGLLNVQLGCEWCDQRIYDLVDTSGWGRECDRIDAQVVRGALDVPRRFDTGPLGVNPLAAGVGGVGKGRGKKRKRGPAAAVAAAAAALAAKEEGGGAGLLPDVDMTEGTTDEGAMGQPKDDGVVAPGGGEANPPIIAGEDDAFFPVPTFLEPLDSREKNVTNWDKPDGLNRTSLEPAYTASHPEWSRQQMTTIRYTRRPRLARGGRIVLDRIPTTVTTSNAAADLQVSQDVYIAGDQGPKGCPIADNKPLFKLLPQPIDHELVSRRIEHICAEAVSDDEDPGVRAASASAAPGGAAAAAAAAASSAAGHVGPGGALAAEGEENDGEATLVKLTDWIGTDDQLWGEERFSTSY